MSMRDDYQKQMGEQLDLWGARLDALKTKTGGLTKVDDPEQYGGWRAKGDTARDKLAELTAANGDQWDVLKLEMDTAWQGLDDAVRQDPPEVLPEPAGLPSGSLPIPALSVDQAVTLESAV